uniref:Secreted protein n=2 Tax=Gloeothece TaxID=28070 RepID=E0U9J3_GLOV7|nr:hypothetical protein Cyan7822_1808 [Gloeothece verrucosa PCC 7822]
MKRTMTITMTLAFVLISSVSSWATATNVDHNQVQKLTIVNGGDGCKGDEKDPCEPPKANR